MVKKISRVYFRVPTRYRLKEGVVNEDILFLKKNEINE